MDPVKKAVEDAVDLLVYTMHTPLATDVPLRRQFFAKLDKILSLFPGAPSKKLVSRIYRDHFFQRIKEILAGGAGAFWLYISRTHEELAPLLIAFSLITYVLAFTGASYLAGAAPELFLASALLYPTILVAFALAIYVLYLYAGYRKWIQETRMLFARMLEEWETLGYVLPPPEHPYEL